MPEETRSSALRYKSEADAALDRAADRLRDVLKEAASRLDPFPPFPSAFFSYGIEIDAPGAESPDRGCVVLAPDGELYEMKMGQDVPTFEFEMTDPVALRQEELKPLDLHPRDYVVYAYSALVKVVDLLLERQTS
ncbi:MAG: hypothetical protein E6J42_08795 [Chloroflexi bacterium]|nr:MAG: hypothetical protein E6J42_08795 [Chloroflexota bacterium]